MVSSTLCFAAVYPYPIALESFLPIYQMSRLIEYGRFFQRIESIFVFAWAASALGYLSIGFFFLVYVFKLTFKLKYYRPLIIPFALIVFVLAILPKSLMTTIKLETLYFRSTAWIIPFALTPILLLIAGARLKSKKKVGGA